MKVFAVAPLAFLAMNGCTTTPVEYATIFAGPDAGNLAKSPYYEVLENREAWESLFARLTANRIPRPTPPEVDFARSRLLFVYMGSQPTTGYGVEVASMERKGEVLTARLRFRRPGPTDLNAYVVTQPYAIVRFARIPGVERLEIRDDEDGKMLRVIPLSE